MLRFARTLVLLFLAPLLPRVAAQQPKPLTLPDERYKADILLVVAHPDDEGAVTPYLTRAIYDEHKRVAVVLAMRGGSGGDDWPAPVAVWMQTISWSARLPFVPRRLREA